MAAAAADDLHSTPFRLLPTSSLLAMLLFMHCARYAPQYNFLVYFYLFFSSRPYVSLPASASAGGEARHGCAAVRKTPVRTNDPVSLGAHADVTMAKHVLIICKRSQLSPDVSVHSLMVVVVAVSLIHSRHV